MIARKTCRTCKTEKSVRQFYRHASYVCGYASDCKECKCAYQREMDLLKRDTILVRKRAYNARPEQIAKRVAYARTVRGRQIKREISRFARRQMEVSHA